MKRGGNCLPFRYLELILTYTLPAAAEKHAPIDEEGKPGYIRGSIRGQEEHGAGDVLRLPQTAHRYPVTEKIEAVASTVIIPQSLLLGLVCSPLFPF
jgi:hypothetical protein